MKKLLSIVSLSIVMLFLTTDICIGQLIGQSQDSCKSPKIKGFCINMSIDEAINVLIKNYNGYLFYINDDKTYTNITESNYENIKIKFMEAVSPIKIYNDKQQKCMTILIKNNVCIEFQFYIKTIFNAEDVKLEDFVQMFCKNYNIPEMQFLGYYLYTNIQEGYEIRIYTNNVDLKQINKSSGIKFD